MPEHKCFCSMQQRVKILPGCLLQICRQTLCKLCTTLCDSSKPLLQTHKTEQQHKESVTLRNLMPEGPALHSESPVALFVTCLLKDAPPALLSPKADATGFWASYNSIIVHQTELLLLKSFPHFLSSFFFASCQYTVESEILRPKLCVGACFIPYTLESKGGFRNLWQVAEFFTPSNQFSPD